MKYLLSLILLFTTTANATWLDIHLTSKHSKPTLFVENKTYNLSENNFGLGLTIPLDDEVRIADARIGFFKNSFSDTSMYLAIDLHPRKRDTVTYGIVLGSATGYSNSPVELNTVPIFMPYVNVNHKRFKFELGYLPAPGIHAVTFSIGYKL